MQKLLQGTYRRRLQQLSKEGIKSMIHHKDPDGDRYDVTSIELLCRECHDFVDFGYIGQKKV